MSAAWWGGELLPDGGETLAVEWRDEREVVETAVWYRAMTEDALSGSKEASFRRGSAGDKRAGEEYYKFIRRYIGQAEYIMPAAVGFVLNGEGHVLLQRRGDNGRWGLPGGAIELGERIDQTVINELFEETGLHVEPTKLLGLYSDDRLRITYPHGDKVKIVSAMLACRVVGGQLQADGHESLEVRFFPPDALPPLPEFHAMRVRDGFANRDEAVF